MIYFVRDADLTGSTINEAVEWAVRVANLINAKHVDANVEVLRNISGPLQQIHWVSRSESLAAWEQIMGAIEGDPEYQALIAEAREKGYFVQGSLTDSLYRTVP